VVARRSRRNHPGWSGRGGVARLLARQHGLASGVQGYSYQVCLSCGAKRLFDEKTFSAYGPFRYDLDALITWEKSRKPKSHPVADVRRPAS
jgi:hypothetical protein